MKVIGIASSPHRSRNWTTLLQEALKGAAQAGAQTHEIYIQDHMKGVYAYLRARGRI
jgi:multimeric flavodoxin WrbA